VRKQEKGFFLKKEAKTFVNLARRAAPTPA
jgi:hypothetical protein